MLPDIEASSTFACRLTVGADPRARLLAASPVWLGVAGALVAVIPVVEALPRGGGAEVTRVLALLGLFAIVATLAVVAIRRLRRLGAAAAVAALPRGELRIDEVGHCTWRAAGAGAAQPVTLQRWFAAGGIAWLRIAPAGQAAIDLLWLRDRRCAAQWRRLCAWLLWRERGGQQR